MKRKLVYTAHSSDSMKFVEFIKEFCYKKGVIPINPFSCFGYYTHYNNVRSEKQAIEDDIELMLRCDELWVFGILTDGIKYELEKWKEAHGGFDKVFFFSFKDVIPHDLLRHYHGGD